MGVHPYVDDTFLALANASEILDKIPFESIDVL